MDIYSPKPLSNDLKFQALPMKALPNVTFQK